MNRLILIGNGFDLAHGLKTDYNSFIVWYLKQCFEKAYSSNGYQDELIEIKIKGSLNTLPIVEVHTISGFVDYYFKQGFSKIFNDQLVFNDLRNYNPFSFNCKSIFITTIISKCNYAHWVDIENEFYNLLKKCFLNDGRPKFEEIEKLNNSLEFVIKQLKSYLLTLELEKLAVGYSDILSSEIKVEDIIHNKKELDKFKLKPNKVPDQTHILNFNYTTTIRTYLRPNNYLPSISILAKTNYIHGQINDDDNPLIFGFGDELDEYYKKMEDSKANEFFKYIKSFWYFKTQNYHDLIRFIESDEYQIYILGHSCGLSDRTLLNMLFEHTNCKSIKIYYHGDKKKNNYTTLTQEISRHFKDKVAMRNKIVPFDLCEAMPQAE